MNNQVNDQRCTDTNGQTGNIDGRENFFSPEISESYNQVILKHIDLFSESTKSYNFNPTVCQPETVWVTMLHVRNIS